MHCNNIVYVSVRLPTARLIGRTRTRLLTYAYKKKLVTFSVFDQNCLNVSCLRVSLSLSLTYFVRFFLFAYLVVFLVNYEMYTSNGGIALISISYPYQILSDKKCCTSSIGYDYHSFTV